MSAHLTDDSAQAANVFAVDPEGIGGVRVRARAGFERDEWLAAVRALLPDAVPWRRVPVGIDDERLLGSVDLAATLAARRVTARAGVIAQANGGVLVIAMAERCEPGVAARIAAAMDRRAVSDRGGVAIMQAVCMGVIALDEAVDGDRAMPAVLAERLGIDLCLEPSRDGAGAGRPPNASVRCLSRSDVAAARALLPKVHADDAIVAALCDAARCVGVNSLRAPWLALRVARAVAACEGRCAVDGADAAWGARLVLGPRARNLPPATNSARDVAQSDADASAARREDACSAQAAPLDGCPSPSKGVADTEASEPLEDRLVEAAKAALPAALLAAMGGGSDLLRVGAKGGSGLTQASASHGRPIGALRGALRGGARLDLLQTIRAAAPWQVLRQRESDGGTRPVVLIRPEDFHVRRYRQRQASTTIFAVDASGSQALNRLAEAKGAVELMLAECYVRRDQVAVIAFRRTGAQVLLPPTRSLLRAKRCLGGLPGGGGTPVAAGLDAARQLAQAISRTGQTPLLVLLTDGSANIARDGTPGRTEAQTDAVASGRAWRATGMAALLIDTATESRPSARILATEMGARYLALPHADAATLARAALPAARSCSAR